MPASFSDDQWERINELLDRDPTAYGMPERIYGSVVMGSFNIRKCGSSRNRSPETWEFLANICQHYDLIAVQEILDDLSGLNRIMELLGPEFGMIVSDKTGVFPGSAGLGERLGFIFRWSVVQRGEVVSDITYDRSKLIEILAENYDAIHEVMAPYAEKFKEYKEGLRGKPRNVKLPAFLNFIRQPYCVSFKIVGHPGFKPYEFMAVNAHLYFGDYMSDRRQEFDALMNWIISRTEDNDKAYHPNFVLLGDLNLDFDNPNTDRARIEEVMKTYDKDGKEVTASKRINVNFPFLDPHPTEVAKNPDNPAPFRTNVRDGETFDHVGFFSKNGSLPTYIENLTMGNDAVGPDFGMFNFTQLFYDVLKDELGLQNDLPDLTTAEKRTFFGLFEHNVSDHMPIWVRLPLPKERFN